MGFALGELVSQRFVILFHRLDTAAGRSDHWDLMLQRGGQLVTWALADEPRVGTVMEALKLSDHRLKYLEYEGPISGDRGEVHRVASGRVEWISESEHQIEVCLTDNQGTTTQVVLSRDRDSNSNKWRCQFDGPDSLPK